MTLRQVLDIVWQRRWLVLITLLLVLATAVAYLFLAPKTFRSVATVKLSPYLSSSNLGNSPFQADGITADPDDITNADLMGQVAEKLNEPSVPALQDAITVEATPGTYGSDKISITALGGTPDQARARANAAAETWVGSLQAKVDSAKKVLNQQLTAVNKRVDRLAAAADSAKNDSQVLTLQLNSATQQQTELRGRAQALEQAGKPAVVQLPAKSGVPTSVKPPTVIAIGIISGLLAGMGVALIRAQFDNRLRTTRDIEAVTGEPVLGEIALDRGRTKRDLTLPVATQRHTAFNESLRAMRTSLQVLAPRRHGVIVVTSPEPGDGKSFIAANLAVSMARSGRSVIIVGGDLRRAKLSQYFGATADLRGFADAIEADASSEELARLLRPTEFDGLKLLPPGSSNLAPADLLATPELGDLIERLRGMADVVVIDTPPALALADAAIIAGHADGVLLLASLDKTRRESLIGTLRVLRANGATIYGVAANKSRRSMPKTYLPYYTETTPGWDLSEGGEPTTEPAAGWEAEDRPATPAATEAGANGWARRAEEAGGGNGESVRQSEQGGATAAGEPARGGKSTRGEKATRRRSGGWS